MKRKGEVIPFHLQQLYKKHLTALNKSFFSSIESANSRDCGSDLTTVCKNYLSYLDDVRSTLLESGKIYSCGNGDCGQLGHKMLDAEDANFMDAVNVKRPKQVETVSNLTFQAIDCGGLHTLAIERTTGNVYSWGCSDSEVLGREGDENIPAPVQFNPSLFKRIVMVSAGDKHSSALDMYGNVFAWGTFGDKDGRNWFLNEESAEKSFFNVQKTPKLVKFQSDNRKENKITDIASGSSHILAVTTDGKVFSWGIGDVGQLGRTVCDLKDSNQRYQKKKVVQDHLIPKLVEFTSDSDRNVSARNVSCGAYHSFIVSTANKVYGCGLNQYSQLALPSDQNIVNKVTKVHKLQDWDIKMMRAGEHFSLALSQQGFVLAFGRCDQSQLGLDLSPYPSKLKPGEFIENPQLIVGKENELKDKIFVNVACGTSHSVLITDENEAYSFGFGDSNQLGHGRAKDEELPRKMKMQGSIITAACGGQHTVFLIQE